MGNEPSFLRLRTGSVVVFEGLDKAGKSTQVELLKQRTDVAKTTWAHMPSGFSAYTQSIYQLLETNPPTSSMSQQLAHLACHAESMAALAAVPSAGALVLDRWWWSTVAYGWYGGALRSSGLEWSAFRAIVNHIWSPIAASAVFLFLTPREADANNVDGVSEGYRLLADEDPGATVLVPDLSPEATHQFLVDALAQADLLE
jgi:dTMP kinase